MSRSHPLNQNGTMAKDKLVRVKVRRAAVLIEFAFWPPRRDELSDVLIGACGTRRSDWPERVKDIRVRAQG